MSRERLLICTDLDRTLLPNGEAPESPHARELFAAFVARPEITFAYVTGRHLALVEDAMDRYTLPMPDFVISDVGSKIWRRRPEAFEPIAEWETEIDADWNGHSHADLAALFDGLEGPSLQDAACQNTHKLSYTLPGKKDTTILAGEMRDLLAANGIRANLIWSHDERTGKALLDVLPAGANKRHAIDFLRAHLGYTLEEVLFAGDSGNDIDVLASPIPSVLVANASPDVRRVAQRAARVQGFAKALYCATGDVLPGLNGNYAAGILEGVVAYHPDYRATIEALDAATKA